MDFRTLPNIEKSGVISTRIFRNEKIKSFYHLKGILKLMGACFYAFLTGISANFKIYLNSTPVPITVQTLVVLSSGYVLGKSFGSLSQLIYVVGALCGFPWVANSKSGMDLLFSSSMGYLIGFILASYCIGIVKERKRDPIAFYSSLNLVFFAILATGVIYFCGLLGLILNLDLTFQEALLQGVVPFILVDSIKILILILIDRLFSKEFARKR